MSIANTRSFANNISHVSEAETRVSNENFLIIKIEKSFNRE